MKLNLITKVNISVSVVDFLVALHQNKQLCGLQGLIPAQKFLKRMQLESKGNNLQIFTKIPSFVWLIDYEQHLDTFLDYTALAGLALSAFVIIVGGANWFIMLALWSLYHSIVNVGSTWYVKLLKHIFIKKKTEEEFSDKRFVITCMIICIFENEKRGDY